MLNDLRPERSEGLPQDFLLANLLRERLRNLSLMALFAFVPHTAAGQRRILTVFPRSQSTGLLKSCY